MWSVHAQPKTERHDDEEQKEQPELHEKRARRKRSLRRTRSQREESYQIPIYKPNQRERRQSKVRN